jgi:ABC-type transporter Mla MlaB component
MVLKITSEAGTDGAERFRLDGRLTSEHLAELSGAIGPALDSPRRVTVNVSGLTFVDSEGARLLKELSARRVDISGCSNFVAHLLGLP